MVRVITMLVMFISTPSYAMTDLTKLTWLKGCWEGDVYGSYVTESWGDSSGDLMLGFSKTVNRGTVESFEFLKILLISGEVQYTPYILGKAADPFKLTKVSANSAVFENLKNDFPKTIEYQNDKNKLEIVLKGTNERGGSIEHSYNLFNCN